MVPAHADGPMPEGTAMTSVTKPSYSHGASAVPLLGETIGANLRRVAARHASSARLETSWSEAPVFVATSATSSNSGLALPLVTFIRMVMPSTVTCAISRADGHRSTGNARIPMVPVDRPKAARARRPAKSRA